MKNKKDKKGPNSINSELDESLLNELKDLESIASEINSKIEKEILDEIIEQDEILKELQPELEEAREHQEIIDEITSEQDKILKELQPELDELKEKEKILDEIIEKESPLLEELKKHESEINELIVGYSETMKDLVNPLEELKEFNELIDKSDKNFYSFAESIRIENEISKEDLEVAPDVLKESVLGKKDNLIKRTSLIKRFEWILKPKAATFSLVGAAIVILLLMPILKDENIDDIIYPNEFLLNEVENSEVPITNSDKEVQIFKTIDADADGMGESPQKNVLRYRPITSPLIKPHTIKVEEVLYRGPIISDDKLVSVLIVGDDLLVISQKDDFERTVKIFQNDEDIIKPKEKLISTKYFSHYTKLSDNNDNFSDLYSSQLLKENGVYENYLVRKMEKGLYRVEVSIFGKVLLNESIIIE